jgi:redox-sensitive bicupin YhaK (pirin superfamily)
MAAAPGPGTVGRRGLIRCVPFDVRRARDRFRTAGTGRDTWHAFSFGPHWDPHNTGFGPLVLHDEHRLAPGAGFDLHPHAGVEVVTWVLAGALDHQDSTGSTGRVEPGQVQLLSAGDGVRHSERNGGPGELRFVQAWLAGDAGPPRYASTDLAAALQPGVLVPVASGRPEHGAALGLRTPAATLHVARLQGGDVVVLPAARRLHVHVGAGEAELEGARLTAGDAARLQDAGQVRLAAHGSAELLVWELDRG